MLLRKLNSTGNERVLWGSIDERNTFQDTSNGKYGGRSHLLVTVLDSFHEVVGSIIHARQEVSKTFSVCSPLNNDLVKAVLRFEVAAKISIFFRSI